MPWMTLVIFLSGFSALVYELLWMRHLGFIFGNTVYASATVLTAFMGGLALGAQVLGRFADRLRRPVLWFAVLEFVVAAAALVMPLFFVGLKSVYAWAYQHISTSLFFLTPLRFVLAVLLLALPTFCMGGTLPLLAAGLARNDERFGRRMSCLYGVNTLGALVGVLVCGFYMIPTFGLNHTNLLAVASDVLAGLGALGWVWFASRTTVNASLADREDIKIRWSTLSSAGRWAFVATAVCGFIALALEVVWFRALILVFGSTTYSFSTMLSVFLCGIAGGALLIAPWLDRGRHIPLVLAICLTGIGGWSLWSMYTYDHGPEFLLNSLVQEGFTWATMNKTRFLIAISHLLIPALFSGAAFAAAARIVRREHAGSAHASGLVYAVNTWGAVLGSFIAGFVLLPMMGMEKSLFLLGFSCLTAGCVGAFLFSPNIASRLLVATAGIFCAVLLVAAPPRWSHDLLAAGAYFSPFNFVQNGRVTLRESILSNRLLIYKEGITSTLSVQESDDEKKIFSVEGKVEADQSTRSMILQRMIGHLPMLFHPHARKAVNIGLGAGVSFGALSTHNPDTLEVVEIEPNVKEATRLWGSLNHHVLDNPKAHVIINDGRNYLLCTEQMYDVITADPFEPVMAGAANLYTVEYFQQAYNRLNSNGIMGQYLPLYELSKDDYLSIVRSFVHVFPQTALFFTGFDTILLGFKDEMKLDADVLRKNYERPQVKSSLSDIGFTTPEMILGMFVADLSKNPGFSQEGHLNTDNHPYVEFSAPRSSVQYTTEANQQALLECFTPIPSNWLAAMDSNTAVRLQREHEAVRLTLESGMLRAQNRIEDAFVKMTQAHNISPNNPVVINEMVAMLLNSASVLRGQGQLTDAVEQFQTALQLQPDEFWALYNLIELSMQAGQLPVGQTLLQQALVRYPDSPLMKGLQGKFLFTLGEKQQGLDCVHQAALAHPSNRGLWLTVQQLATALGDYTRVSEARKHLRQLEAFLLGQSFEFIPAK
ncbi:MAG: hypothetical protein A2X46_06420 [Lentisphaerae bacterium GWF2_57_35]|nr:MAG: hypothetical protein A2X46_06420 [Lentisphaerae bacterium GWF2_57_35]